MRSCSPPTRAPYRSCLEQIQPRTPHRRFRTLQCPRSAERAVKKLGWTKPWHVDADHIRLETVDRFLPCSGFVARRADVIGSGDSSRWSFADVKSSGAGRKRSTVSRRI